MSNAAAAFVALIFIIVGAMLMVDYRLDELQGKIETIQEGINK